MPTKGGLLVLVNRGRIRAGLAALRVSAALTRAAQAKADDMARLGYFDHNSPEGRTPWDFLASEGYRYSDAGENLAAGWRTDEEVMRGWMGSVGHRANLLSRAFQETGIGIARGARHSLKRAPKRPPPKGDGVGRRLKVAGRGRSRSRSRCLRPSFHSVGIVILKAVDLDLALWY